MTGMLTAVKDALLPYVPREQLDAAARAAVFALRRPDPSALEVSWQATRAATPEQRMRAVLATPRDAHHYKMRLRWGAMVDHILRDRDGAEGIAHASAAEPSCSLSSTGRAG